MHIYDRLCFKVSWLDFDLPSKIVASCVGPVISSSSSGAGLSLSVHPPKLNFFKVSAAFISATIRIS